MARRMKGGGDLGSNPEPPPTTVPSNMAPIAPQASQQQNSAQQNMMAQQQALINQQAYLLAQQMVYQQMMCQQPPPPPPLYPPPPAPSAGADAKRGSLYADDFTGDSMPEPTQNIRNIIKEYHGRNPQRSFSPEEPKIAQSRACPRPSDPHDQAIAILQGQRETPDIWSNPASTRKPHTEGKPVSLVTTSAIERSHETIARVKPVGISSHPDFTKMPPTPTSFAPATCRRKQSSVRFVEDVERGTPSVETAKPQKLLTPLHGKRPGAAYCYRGVPWKLVIRKEVRLRSSSGQDSF
uniref:Uncharacterized protein n=2 Tax=Eptatretus burgeri TaxID=7764 RepID=A0A8C4QQ65_EPTBU